MSQTGDRKGVDESDLQTGNIEAGKRYFNGAGRCATCHSATGDLAGVGIALSGIEARRANVVPKNIPSQRDRYDRGQGIEWPIGVSSTSLWLP